MKTNKFKSKVAGKFRSKLERTIWKQLPHKNKKVKIEYEAEKLPYVIERNYLPDFVIHRQDGTKFYIEVKGFFPSVDRVKLEAVKKAHPDLDIRIVFGSNAKLYKGSNTRNADWAKRRGFPCAIKTIPKEWFIS